MNEILELKTTSETVVVAYFMVAYNPEIFRKLLEQMRY